MKAKVKKRFSQQERRDAARQECRSAASHMATPGDGWTGLSSDSGGALTLLQPRLVLLENDPQWEGM